MNNIPMSKVLNHKLISGKYGNNYIFLKCEVYPRFLRCFGLDMEISDIHCDYYIAKNIIIKYRIVSDEEQKIEMERIFLLNTLHPNALEVEIEEVFDNSTISTLVSYMGGNTPSVYEMCKDPWKTYSGDKVNIALNKLVNNLSFWNMDDSYWFDISKISTSFGKNVVMVLDHNKDDLISIKTAERRMRLGRLLNNTKKASKLFGLNEKEYINGWMKLSNCIQLT